MQQMNFKGGSIDEIANTLVYKRLSLDYNYRLPKTIAKVAQQIQDVKVDLLTNNMKDGGNKRLILIIPNRLSRNTHLERKNWKAY